MDDILKHYGVARRSGRYPWGSGRDPKQRNRDFLGYVESLKKEGISEVDIAKGLGMTTSQLRTRKSIAKSEIRASQVREAMTYKDKGMSNVAIGLRMGLNESSVRALLDPAAQVRSDIAVSTSNMLRDTIEKKGIIDIGAGTESQIGISRTKLGTAVSLLEEEGYKVHYVKVEQLGTGKQTTIKVLAPPEMSYSDVYKNRSNIKTVSDFSATRDGGRSYYGLDPIKSVSSDRIHVRGLEDGGADRDGVIELRRGVSDLNLGNQKYAQVRIAVDGTHFLKGMAMYSDDIPNGVDIVYNTNKSKTTPKKEVFKPMKDDPDNPFGAVIKPQGQKGALNVVNEEGDWGKWSKSISSQVLSKQSPALAKKQLGLAKAIKEEEFDEIASLTNPVIKKNLLKSFSDDADASAVHLKAAALPRQASHVILPIPSMKPHEIYAPNYQNGESVVLIRHPHGGTFEIPELRVNNKNPQANSVIKNARDAVGIHPSVAKKLSGADFDGDTVLVIPNRDGLVKTSPSLKSLQDFDPRIEYPAYPGMPKMTPRAKQMQMGVVSNLITDMTIKGATANEIARAVKHSMVVIDAEKHNLNYKQSALDNGIADLKKKYQGSERAGASTLISRASSEIRVPKRKDSFRIDPVTGRKIFEETGETFINSKGKVVKKTTLSTRAAETDDAFTLSSGTKIESIYAQHANDLKALANKARLLILKTPNLVYSPTAKQTYATEVASLKAKLNTAYKNKPLERQAQLLANKIVAAKKQANPNMDAADLKKIKGQALEEARVRTGAKKQKIEITDREWEAIQLGAISNNTLTQILLNTDAEALKIRATPRSSSSITPAKLNRAKSMSALGYTTAEIASALGLSTSTIQEAIK